MLGCLKIMIILFRADHSLILLVHYLMISFFFSYITLVFLNIRYVSISDGHDDILTWIFTIHHIPYDLQWLHVLVSSLLLYEFGSTPWFRIGWTRLLSVLTPCCFLFEWMNMSAYDIFLPNFLSSFSMLDSIKSLIV